MKVAKSLNLIPIHQRIAKDTFLVPPRIKVFPYIPPLATGARACFQTLLASFMSVEIPLNLLLAMLRPLRYH